MHVACRLFVLAALTGATPALAQQTLGPSDAPAANGNMVTIGAGVAVLPDYDGSNDMRLVAAPGARAQLSGMTFTWVGNRGWADLIPNPPKGLDLQLGPLVNVDLNRALGVGDRRVNALGKIPIAVEGGVQAGIGYQGLITSDYDKLSLSVGYVHDIGGVHKSYVITPEIDYATPLSRHALIDLTAEADYAGNGYMRRYFGVTPGGSAASGLPAFTPRAGWKDWAIIALTDVSLTGDLTHGLQLVAAASYRRLIGDAALSPIVSEAGTPDQWIGALGVAYTF